MSLTTLSFMPPLPFPHEHESLTVRAKLAFRVSLCEDCDCHSDHLCHSVQGKLCLWKVMDDRPYALLLYFSMNWGILFLLFPYAFFFFVLPRESPQAESLRIESGFLSVLEAKNLMTGTLYRVFLCLFQNISRCVVSFRLIVVPKSLQLSCLGVVSCKDPGLWVRASICKDPIFK